MSKKFYELPCPAAPQVQFPEWPLTLLQGFPQPGVGHTLSQSSESLGDRLVFTLGRCTGATITCCSCSISSNTSSLYIDISLSEVTLLDGQKSSMPAAATALNRRCREGGTRQHVHRQRVSYDLSRLILSVTFSESSLILCWCSHHSFCMLIVTCVAWLVFWPCEARIWPATVMALLTSSRCLSSEVNNCGWPADLS